MITVCQAVVVICAVLLLVMLGATGLVAALRFFYGVETITPEKIRSQWSFDVIPEGYRTGDVLGPSQPPVRNP